MLFFNRFYHLLSFCLTSFFGKIRLRSGIVLLLGIGWLTSASPVLALWQQTFVDKNVDGTGSILALAVDKSDNLYAGGDFTSVGGVSANHIAKWDGEKWTALGDGRDNPVNALVVDSVGNVYTLERNAQVVAKWDQSSWTTLNLEGLILPEYQAVEYDDVSFDIQVVMN